MDGERTRGRENHSEVRPPKSRDRVREEEREVGREEVSLKYVWTDINGNRDGPRPVVVSGRGDRRGALTEFT